jgi:outer membrane lipoprotein carrier protein
MRALLRWSLAATALCAAQMAHASVEQLRAFLTQTQSARGEFTQRVAGASGSRASAVPQASSGNFVFQRPGKFRWVYAKPYEQVIVGDGQRLYLYDKDLNQVTVKKLAGALPASPASILFGSNDFERDFAVKDAGARDGLSWIEATPRAKDSPFSKIEIGFREGLPGAMRLTDSFGQVSQLAFEKVERNPKLAPDIFRFTPPQGADVLNEN